MTKQDQASRTAQPQAQAQQQSQQTGKGSGNTAAGAKGSSGRPGSTNQSRR